MKKTCHSTGPIIRTLREAEVTGQSNKEVCRQQNPGLPENAEKEVGRYRTLTDRSLTPLNQLSVSTQSNVSLIHQIARDVFSSPQLFYHLTLWRKRIPGLRCGMSRIQFSKSQPRYHSISPQSFSLWFCRTLP